MPSPLFVSLQGTLNSLRQHLIVTGKEYDKYTPAEHSQALGFRVLASAHLEDYAEKRCSEVAKIGIDRLKRGQPTRTGGCLVVWYLVRKEKLVIPLSSGEIVHDEKIDLALEVYQNMVGNKHGIGASNLKNLVVPLGVRESGLDDILFTRLGDLAEKRGAAAHVRVNRAKAMQDPDEEWKQVDAILPLLQKLDEHLDVVLHDR
ncbi:hypothetical protein ACIRSS_18050 [Amycolatopsis sp. NPDC101161]|uniref:hypothetical protein n=1 Tax=Amycolatopsis sp. NPDC101161 TaxID=3363940 RepID=UPI0037F3FB25